MRALLAGLPPGLEYVPPKGWQVELQPLQTAQKLTEYDAVLLWPYMYGGIFDSKKVQVFPDGTLLYKGVQGNSRALQEEFAWLKFELLQVAANNCLVVFPVPDTELSWRSPKYDAQWMLPSPNMYDYYRLKALSILSGWSIGVEESRSGKSVSVVAKGHPLSRYLALPGMQWDCVYSTTNPNVKLAVDRSGAYDVAFEALLEGIRLTVLPASSDRRALEVVLDGLQDMREFYDSQQVRSGTEYALRQELQMLEQQRQAIETKVIETATRLDEARAHRMQVTERSPVLRAALGDYEGALRDKDITGLSHSLERMKKGSKLSEQEFRDVVGLTAGEWDAVMLVANRSDRHPPKGDPAGSIEVSNGEFRRASEVLKKTLEWWLENRSES